MCTDWTAWQVGQANQHNCLCYNETTSAEYGGRKGGRTGLLRQFLDMHDLSGWQSDGDEEITAFWGRLTVLLGQLYFSKIS